MFILNETPVDGKYQDIVEWPGVKAPNGYLWWPDYLEKDTFEQYQGYVILEVARGTVVSCTPNQPAFQAWQAARLAARKVERIAESKTQLSDYLLCHPMQWTDGQYYAITAEKQQQLTGKIMSATLAAPDRPALQPDLERHRPGVPGLDVGKPDGPGLCHRRRVTSLVSYQQAQEVAMREASTLEALEAIPVDYDSVPLPGGETA